MNLSQKEARSAKRPKTARPGRPHISRREGRRLNVDELERAQALGPIGPMPAAVLLISFLHLGDREDWRNL